ncbi:MAG TPA: hypothetical protein VFY85_08195 [Gemmatimonadaceae bacterium]|nr:hypothetical protein [Gemmatimonadaceae bacterium]
MRSRPAVLIAGLCLIAAAAYAPVAIARQTVPRGGEGATQSRAKHADQEGYSSDERDFTPGRSVHLRSTKTRIGQILATDENHEFPPTFRTTHAKAVLIRHVDGPLDWTPVEGLARIYVVR